MANTVVAATILSASVKRVIVMTQIVYVDANETDLVVYDSSVVATALGISDPLACSLLHAKIIHNCASTARLKLEFDANTDILALACPASNSVNMNFERMGGLKNTSGTGKTGDITLTTAGLSAGDAISIILDVRPG